MEIAEDNELVIQFEETKQKLLQAPVYNQEIHAKVQAFAWVYMTSRLLEGRLKVDEN